MIFSIIGAGNAGCAFAAHLGLLGHETRLYDVLNDQLDPLISNRNRIEISGNLPIADLKPGSKATVELTYVGQDLMKVIPGADLILCTTPAHVHRLVAHDLAPHVRRGQIVVLNPGRTCGAIEFSNVLKENGAADVGVIEAQTLLYACRRENASVHVFGLKGEVRCAAIDPATLDRFLAQIGPVIPQFTVAEQGIWETSLDNVGMLFHPAPTLLNLSRMESGQPFDYYTDGMTPTVAALVEQLDEERCAVAAGMGVTIPKVTDWLHSTYSSVGATLYEAVQNNGAYRGIRAPQLGNVNAKQTLRYVVEDVPTGLVPTADLARRFGIETPAIDAVIDLANTVYRCDFRAHGRTLDRLGLGGFSSAKLCALGSRGLAVG